MEAKCPNCGSDDIGIRRKMEELSVFTVIETKSGKYLDEELADRGYVGKPKIICFNCNESYTFEEYLENE